MGAPVTGCLLSSSTQQLKHKVQTVHLPMVYLAMLTLIIIALEKRAQLELPFISLPMLLVAKRDPPPTPCSPNTRSELYEGEGKSLLARVGGSGKRARKGRAVSNSPLWIHFGNLALLYRLQYWARKMYSGIRYVFCSYFSVCKKAVKAPGIISSTYLPLRLA